MLPPFNQITGVIPKELATGSALFIYKSSVHRSAQHSGEKSEPFTIFYFFHGVAPCKHGKSSDHDIAQVALVDLQFFDS